MLRWIQHRRSFYSGDIIGLSNLPICDSVVKSFCCFQHDEHEVDSVEPGIVVPPFVCKFCPKRGRGHLAAIADEDGIVRLCDTRPNDKSIVTAFTAHSNAIFDLAWMNDSAKLVTASGDQSAVVWNVEKGVSIATMKGHSCSLKSVAVSSCNSNILATGARDGNVMVWDLRCNQRGNGSYAPVKMIHCAHTDLTVAKAPKIKRRRLSQTRASRDSQQSVTSVVFHEQNSLLTSGATDGTIKLWDLRKPYIGTSKTPVPVRQFPYAGTSTRRHGYSCLTLDPACSRLYASCTDDIIYEYDLMTSSSNPLGKYTGHQNSTFYVKSCLSADGTYLLSGSSDNNACIWKVGSCGSPIVKLTGHQGEVTSVSWCPEDFTKIMTCADDNTFRVWRSKVPVLETKDFRQSIVGKAEIVGKVDTHNDVSTRHLKSCTALNSLSPMGVKPTEGITANLPTAVTKLFSVVKPKPKVLKDVTLRTFLKMDKKESNIEMEKLNIKKDLPIDNDNRNNLEELHTNNMDEVYDIAKMNPTTPENDQACNNSMNKENSPTGFDREIQNTERNIDECTIVHEFDSPKRLLKLQEVSIYNNSKKMVSSPTANLPNRVLDYDLKAEQELPMVWNKKKVGDLRKLKANWLEEFSRKFRTDPPVSPPGKFSGKGSPKLLKSFSINKLENMSPLRFKRKIQSTDSPQICQSPSNSRSVPSQAAGPKMRKISAYFQPVSQ